LLLRSIIVSQPAINVQGCGILQPAVPDPLPFLAGSAFRRFTRR
jgi:hypothetical protein